MRMFPILATGNRRHDGGERRVRAVPWAMMAPHEGAAKDNHDQTLERLAERGGLSAYEAVRAIEDRRLFPIPSDHGEAESARLVGYLDAFLERQKNERAEAAEARALAAEKRAEAAEAELVELREGQCPTCSDPSTCHSDLRLTLRRAEAERDALRERAERAEARLEMAREQVRAWSWECSDLEPRKHPKAALGAMRRLADIFRGFDDGKAGGA